MMLLSENSTFSGINPLSDLIKVISCDNTRFLKKWSICMDNVGQNVIMEMQIKLLNLQNSRNLLKIMNGYLSRITQFTKNCEKLKISAVFCICRKPSEIGTPEIRSDFSETNWICTCKSNSRVILLNFFRYFNANTCVFFTPKRKKYYYY